MHTIVYTYKQTKQPFETTTTKASKRSAREKKKEGEQIFCNKPQYEHNYQTTITTTITTTTTTITEMTNKVDDG